MTASGRVLVQKLAAHIVHLLDHGDGEVVVSPLRLRHTLIVTLAIREYSENLVAYPLMVLPSGPDAAAQRYLECVVDRRLQLARNLPRHKAHELFEAMCRRGAAPGWVDAVVGRESDAAANAGQTPTDLPAVAHRLGQIDAWITPGNPAKGTRERLGPLLLVAGGSRLGVPEELTIWQAITTGPLKLAKLHGRETHNALCSLMIKSMEVTNTHWAALARLGLWPVDWIDSISVNTAKHASAFMAAVRGLSAGLDDRLEHWQTAWSDHPVPGFKSAEVFWASSLGEAIRRGRQRPLELHDEQIADERDEEAQQLDELEFSDRLKLALEQGVIDAAEAWFLAKLQDGEAIADLVASGELEARRPGADPEEFAAELIRKLIAFAKRMED